MKRAETERLLSVADDPKNASPTWEIEGLRRFLRLLNTLPKEMQNETRDASQEIANRMVSSAKNAAHTPLQTLAASTLTAKRDRIPVVQSKGTVRKGVKAQDIFYGAEFGGGKRPTTRQFLPHRGKRGYFLYPAIRSNSQRFWDDWVKAIETAMAGWDHPGGE